MNELMDYGRARAIQLAVLIDRGHRELPIREASRFEQHAVGDADLANVMQGAREIEQTIEVGGTAAADPGELLAPGRGPQRPHGGDPVGRKN